MILCSPLFALIGTNPPCAAALQDVQPFFDFAKPFSSAGQKKHRNPDEDKAPQISVNSVRGPGYDLCVSLRREPYQPVAVVFWPHLHIRLK